MKQTQTHVWSLAGEEAVSYSLARGKAAAVTRESGEVAAYSLARAISISCTWAVPRRDRGKTICIMSGLPRPGLARSAHRGRIKFLRGYGSKSSAAVNPLTITQLACER